MKNKHFLFIVMLFIQVSSVMGQRTMSLSPAAISPANRIITVTTAGMSPLNPMVTYTSQSVQYKWAEILGGPYGNFTVQSSSIPSGLKMTIKASGDSGPQNRFGTADVTVTVGLIPQVLIANIIGTNASDQSDQSNVKQVSRLLTQDIIINDFSQLHPGVYQVTLTYFMQ